MFGRINRVKCSYGNLANFRRSNWESLCLFGGYEEQDENQTGRPLPRLSTLEFLYFLVERKRRNLIKFGRELMGNHSVGFVINAKCNVSVINQTKFPSRDRQQGPLADGSVNFAD